MYGLFLVGELGWEGSRQAPSVSSFPSSCVRTHPLSTVNQRSHPHHKTRQDPTTTTTKRPSHHACMHVRGVADARHKTRPQWHTTTTTTTKRASHHARTHARGVADARVDDEAGLGVARLAVLRALVGGEEPGEGGGAHKGRGKGKKKKGYLDDDDDEMAWCG